MSTVSGPALRDSAPCATSSGRAHAGPPRADVQIHWHVHMQKAELSPQDVADLLAFLDTLTDSSLAPRVPDAVPSGLPVVPRLKP